MCGGVGCGVWGGSLEVGGWPIIMNRLTPLLSLIMDWSLWSKPSINVRHRLASERHIWVKLCADFGSMSRGLYYQSLALHSSIFMTKLPMARDGALVCCCAIRFRPVQPWLKWTQRAEVWTRLCLFGVFFFLFAEMIHHSWFEGLCHSNTWSRRLVKSWMGILMRQQWHPMERNAPFNRCESRQEKKKSFEQNILGLNEKTNRYSYSYKKLHNQSTMHIFHSEGDGIKTACCDSRLKI